MTHPPVVTLDDVRAMVADMRYNWPEVRLDAIDRDELEELVLDASLTVVPKSVATEHLGQ